MKHLHDKNDGMTDDAHALDLEAEELLKPLFDKYHAMGYSARDISYVIANTVRDCELDVLVFRDKDDNDMQVHSNALAEMEELVEQINTVTMESVIHDLNPYRMSPLDAEKYIKTQLWKRHGE